MEQIITKKGLNLPISGAPAPTIRPGAACRTVAVIGDDSVGMKPTMEVEVGDMVKTGQLLFTNKKASGQRFVAPGCGKVIAINRGAKRKFESLVIELAGDEAITFIDNPGQPVDNFTAEEIRELLVESGLWASFRTRPYGKIPEVDAVPASLFITAMDSEPLAPPPELIISARAADYQLGLELLNRLVEVPIHYCCADRELGYAEKQEDFRYWAFTGPHPAGLASTHIHFIDPVHEQKTVWHIGYQDVISIGYLFRTGTLLTERTVSLAGPGVRNPSLVTTRLGANLNDLCAGELKDDTMRIISGSVLSGRTGDESHAYLGRYHNQVSVLPDNSGRSLLNWALPGAKRFSVKPVFSSAINKLLNIDMNTAVWGGHRAIYPLGTYEDVMPLDIIPTYLMRALMVGDTEKAKALGCLELIEEDVAPCSFACPGKNEFGSKLRQVLTTIEIEG